MSLHIVCQHCSGELTVPDTSAGKDVRCPYCARVFVCPLTFDDAPEPTPTLEDSTPWTPQLEEQIDGPMPWYLFVFALAPGGLLYFVTVEPAALAAAGVLVVLALFLATRRTLSRWTRLTGVVALATLGYGMAAAAHLYGEGSLSRLGVAALPLPVEKNVSNVADATWKDTPFADGHCSVLFPGRPVSGNLPQPKYALDIKVHESRFQNVAFALYEFDHSHRSNFTEGDLDEIASWITNAELENFRRIYYFDHPGREYQFFDLTKPSTKIECQAYLVGGRAYLLTVTADKFDAIKPLAEKFFESFRLPIPIEAAREKIAEPNWKERGREPIPRPNPKASYRGHNVPPILDLAFSTDGKSLLTGSGHEHVVLWNLETGHGGVVISTEPFEYFAIDPRKKYLVAPFSIVGGPSGELQFLEIKRPIPDLLRSNTDNFAFPPDGKTVIVGIGSLFGAWSVEGSKKLWHRNADATPLGGLALTRDGKLLAAALLYEPTIKLWNVAKQGSDLASWKAHGVAEMGPAIQQLSFAPDGSSLASAGLDASVKIWSLADVNRPRLTANMLHENSVASVEYSNDGKKLATGDYEGVVRIWDPATAKLLNEFRACEAPAPIQGLRFSPDDKSLAAAVELGFGRAGVNLFEIASLPPAGESPSSGFLQTEEPPTDKTKK